MGVTVSRSQVELAAGEAVRWSGGAEQVPWFVAVDLFLVPFTFLWAGGAIAAVVTTAVKHPSRLPFAALFVVIGLYISVGRLLVRRRNWRRNEYTVTSERVIVTRGSNEDSAWLDQLPPPVTSGKHAVGFGSNLGVQGRLAMEGWPMASMTFGWFGNRHPVIVGVPDAQSLRRTVRDAQSEARRRRN